MDDMQNVAYAMAMTAVFNAQIAGMVAENDQRKHLDQSMAYDEDACQKAIDSSGIHHNAIMELFYPK